MAIKYTGGKWMNCAWGGRPQSEVSLPPNSTNFISTFTYTKFVEINGRKYSFMPKNIIAIDVDVSDIEYLTKEGFERTPNDNELSFMDGYLARRWV